MHIAVVGLGFGGAFVPIYQAHPLVDRVTVCDPKPEALARAIDEFKPNQATDSLEKVLQDPTIDAVHLLSPLHFHADQSVQVLEAGKHCACAVTMACSLEDIQRVIQAKQASGKAYMMMETGVYTREYLFAKDLLDSGRLGKITYLRGDYFQDLEAPYPDYWRKVPPMHYATHCLGPILALAQTRATKVSCLGSGTLRKDICDDPFNPFPCQTAHFRLEGHDAAVQVSRAWYQAAREYVESFSVYGDKMGFEWQQLEREEPVVYELEPYQSVERWHHCESKRTHVPPRPELLPKELKDFADGGHGGSHGHLVHEFLTSIHENRKPLVDEITAANWCAAGICAHESSLKDGEWVSIPKFG